MNDIALNSLTNLYIMYLSDITKYKPDSEEVIWEDPNYQDNRLSTIEFTTDPPTIKNIIVRSYYNNNYDRPWYRFDVDFSDCVHHVVRIPVVLYPTMFNCLRIKLFCEPGRT